MKINIEMKAHCDNPGKIREILMEHKADFRGKDHQIDTYFKIGHGRLKLREGNIENSLIYYERPDTEGIKKSDCVIVKTEPGSQLKQLLSDSIGILVVVDKEREIYFIDNIKFHIDYVKGLGSFVEIEAQGVLGEEEKLQEQCERFLKLFKIPKKDMVSVSYSDLLMEKGKI